MPEHLAEYALWHIPKQAFSAAIYTRLLKNLLELAADIPLLFFILPVMLMTYKRAFRNSSVSL